MPSPPEQPTDNAARFAEPAARPRVFISYARADGESIARELRRRLVAGPPALAVWQDRAELEGGVGWWRQITDALDQVEFLVLLITPAAQRSDMVQREWRYARQQGVCVYPVFSAELRVDFSLLRRWMRKAHFFDLEREWDSLVAHLARPAVVKRIPFMAPELVTGFVARPDVMQPLRAALLATTDAPVAITTALQGAGGLGKTTLAVALCHDEDVIEAFDDGIVWVTLGNEPKLLDELAKVYVALTGRRPAFVDADDASYHLGMALEQRNCLIVIDDVWHAAHLKPFMRGGRGCVRLITTRLADIAPDAARFAVDAMSRSQATELLLKRLQPTPGERAALRQLAARLGEWPLLLELANAQLRRRVDKGDTLASAIAHAEQRLQREGVTAFDMRHAEQRQEAVARTMQLSLDLLGPDEVAAFTQLAVFPEDADIPLAVAAALWQRDAFEAEDLAQLLDDISLARFSPRTGALRLHDLIRAYAATRVHDLTALHRELAARLASSPLADADYAWRRRPWHLLQGGEVEALRALLEDPDWLLAKLQHTDVVALGEDFDLVDDALLRLVQQAIRLAGAALVRRAAELPAQLLARLQPDPEAPRLQSLRARAVACRQVDWLHPLRALLTPAGSPNVATLLAHAAPVLCLALSDDGTLLASGAADGSLRLWDWRRGKPLSSLAGHRGRVRGLAFAHDAEVLASVGEDGWLRLWDVRLGSALGELALGGDGPQQVVAGPTPGSPWLVVAGGGLWAVDAGVPPAMRPLIGPDAAISDLALGAGGLAVGACGGRWWRQWRVDGAHAVLLCEARLPHVSTTTAAPEAGFAFSAGGDGRLVRWALPDADLRPTGEAGAAPDAVAGQPVGTLFDSVRLAVDPRARRLVAASRAWTVDVTPLDPPAPMRSLAGHGGPVNDVCVTPDAALALSAADDGSVRVWDLNRPLIAKPRPAHLQPVRALAFAADGRHAFSTSDGHELLQWDCMTAEPCGRVHGPGAWRVETPDGTGWALWLMAGRRLHCRRLDDADRSTVLHDDELQGQALRAQAVALAGGSTLVIDAGRSLTLWCGEPPRCDLALASSAEFAHDLAFSVDGAHLAHLGSDGVLVQWQLAPAGESMRLAALPGAVALAAEGECLALAPAEAAAVHLLRAGAAPRALAVDAPLRDLAFARGSALLLCASADGVLGLWDVARGAVRASFTTESPLTCCAITSDGFLAAAGDESGQVHFFALHEAQASPDGPVAAV